MQTAPSSASGGCLCGEVRFRVNGPLRDVFICHCAVCRRQSTHVGAYTACAPNHFILEKAETLRWYQSSPAARRGFCSACGSQLLWEPNSGDQLSIAAGCLDSTVGLTVRQHIFVAEKAPYYEITDGYPQRPD